MTTAKVVLRGAEEITFARSGIQLKDQGKIVAVYDDHYRIVAEFPSKDIASFSEESCSGEGIMCGSLTTQPAP